MHPKNTKGDWMKVIYKLREIRTEKAISLRELEQLSGVSIATLSRIENQAYNPTMDVLCSIAEVLNVSLFDLFYTSNE